MKPEPSDLNGRKGIEAVGPALAHAQKPPAVMGGKPITAGGFQLP
ncbi:hypothetical protein BN979_06059 [Mycolicibacterium vulneris]|nr:hypothetical protein BN979_06059 [Mycolicibacterium vulneris]